MLAGVGRGSPPRAQQLIDVASVPFDEASSGHAGVLLLANWRQ